MIEDVSRPSLAQKLKIYIDLTKPGIIFGNIITAAGGFALASRIYFDFSLFMMTLIGLSLVIASACVFNNYIDRQLDQKMARTKNRALALGLISTRDAKVFAVILGISGTVLLTLLTNLLTVSFALIGFFVYTVLYTRMKYRSTHGTLIGSIAGATPPVVGYCAVTNQFDVGAFIFFTMMVMWQMPHFFAIALYRLEDYTKAEIPLLPITKGLLATKVQMFFYILGFIISSCMLTICGYAGSAYLIVAMLLGLTWMVLSLQGFQCKNDTLWARKMFFFSLIVVMGVCGVIPFSV